MSRQNVDLVPSTYAAWEGGDFRSVKWAHPDIEYVSADGPTAVEFSPLLAGVTDVPYRGEEGSGTPEQALEALGLRE